MTRPVETLQPREARAYLAVRRAIDYGKHSRTYDVADVIRVTIRYFAANAHLRAINAATARADRAEAEKQALLVRVGQLEHELLRHTAVPIDDLPPRKVIELTRSQFECFALYCEGHQRQAIAAELGIDPRTVSNYVSRVSDLIGADAATAAALVNRSVVRIQTRGKKAA